MAEAGRTIMILGVALILIGGAIILLGRTGMPLGRLPGDIVYKGKNTTFYFPLVTSIVVSIVVSVLIYLFGRFRR
jgi:hypothetical protein